MRVSSAINIDDLRTLAKRRLPRMVFDYIDGGADDERTLAANIERFRQRQLVWNALVDVSEIDTSTTLMGSKTRLPFVLAPTAAQRLFHPRLGELAAARAAQTHDVIYSVSTVATQTVEAIAEAHPGPKWFQVYVWRDRGVVERVLERAKAAGFTALALTVDVPVIGNRERDPRNGFTIPVSINAKTAAQALARPGYLVNLALGGPAVPANVPRADRPAGYLEYDPSVTWEYARWLKQTWDGPIAIKGLSRADDARRAIDHGADAVWVSNHGGRQLDTAPATIDTLPAIAAAVNGQAEIILDGGIRRGADIIKALAMGANGVAIGRAYLYGLAAGGEAGVSRAIEILGDELRRNMALLGRPRLADLTPDILFEPG